MIVNLKFFYEKTDANYNEYNKLWNENRNRIIFLHDNVSPSTQKNCIKHDIINDITNNKDILAIRFPNDATIKLNKIINNIILGKGFIYADNKTWFPKEVWIYGMYCNK